MQEKQRKRARRTDTGRKRKLLDRAGEIARMRVAGLSLEEIAAKFNATVGAVRDALDAALSVLSAEIDAEKLRALEFARTEALLRTLHARLDENPFAATDRILRTSEHRLRLAGANADEGARPAVVFYLPSPASPGEPAAIDAPTVAGRLPEADATPGRGAPRRRDAGPGPLPQISQPVSPGGLASSTQEQDNTPRVGFQIPVVNTNTHQSGSQRFTPGYASPAESAQEQDSSHDSPEPQGSSGSDKRVVRRKKREALKNPFDVDGDVGTLEMPKLDGRAKKRLEALKRRYGVGGADREDPADMIGNIVSGFDRQVVRLRREMREAGLLDD